MAKKQVEQLNKTREEWHNRRKNALQGMSIYTLLWMVFSFLSIAVVVSLSIVLSVSVSKTYKTETVKELEAQRKFITMDVTSETPLSFSGDFNDYVRFLSSQYDANIYILDRRGTVVFPHMPDFSTDDLDKDANDFSRQLDRLKAEIEKTGAQDALFEGDAAYVYGQRITLQGGEYEAHYLYVEKSLEFIQNVTGQILSRTLVLAISVTIIALVLSSALAAWMIKPISAMTQNARRLALGDFAVSFRGLGYGRELSELAQTLDFARREISKMDTLQRELIANISHDFKTPLTMVKAYAAMIMDISGEVKEKRDKHAQVIIDEADRLAALVGDVLDLSKLRSGLQELKIKTVEMSAYTQEILERFSYLTDTQGYVFVKDIEEDLVADIDELKIGQVLYNLIGNAINYTGADKTIYVSLKKNAEGTGFRFSVRDTGKGIKPEELETIWERYYRSKEMHKRPIGGTGLGLSIVKAVLVRHDLNFGIDSEIGQGSTFFVDFPLKA